MPALHSTMAKEFLAFFPDILCLRNCLDFVENKQFEVGVVKLHDMFVSGRLLWSGYVLMY